MRRSIPNTAASPRKLVTYLSTAALGCGLALCPALPTPGTAPAAFADEGHGPSTASRVKTAANTEYQIVRGVPADLLNAQLRDEKLTLSAATGQEGADSLDPARTVFNLPAHQQNQTRTAAGYEFIAPQGTPIWVTSQQHSQGMLSLGLSADRIPAKALSTAKLKVELIAAETPKGARAEIFRQDATGPSRMFSTADRLAPYELEADKRVSAAWAFTAAGTYRFTFRTSAKLADGTQVHAQATYTVVVGELPANLERQQQVPAPGNRTEPAQKSTGSASPSKREQPARQAPEDAAPAGAREARQSGTPEPLAQGQSDRSAPSGTTRQSSAQQAPAQQNSAPQNSAPQRGSASAESASSQPQALAQTATDPQDTAGGGAVSDPVAGAPRGTVTGSNSGAVTAPGSDGSGGAGAASAGGAQGGSFPGSQTEKCIPTEVVVKDSVQSRGARTPAGVPGSLPVVKTADHTGANRATEGHFDVGPVLNGSTLGSAVKDDRFSPPRHVSPGSLEFVLGDAAKLTFPAGMEDVAPAGSTVHMIGATQQANVPWLGWSTQDPELLKQADGPVTMSLKGFDGPGSMSVFLSGNFGSAGQKVFDSRGGSFQVPLNTHQHSNWVFTAEGRYRVTIGWKVRLKNGQTVESTSTLNFAVGDADHPAPAPGQKNAPADATDSKAQKPEEQQGQRGAEHAGRGTVDAASGLVTKPDGTQVRIVGKTASGKDCALTNQELQDAQAAAAAGTLANTGAGLNPFMVSTSVLALGLGAMIVYTVRRRKRHAAS